MTPYDQSGRPNEQPTQGGQAMPPGNQGTPAWIGGAQQGGQLQQPPQSQSIAELSVETPTLLRVSLQSFGEQIQLGPDDYVLDSIYNHQVDAWEVLVIVEPREDEANEEEEDEE